MARTKLISEAVSRPPRLILLGGGEVLDVASLAACVGDVPARRLCVVVLSVGEPGDDAQRVLDAYAGGGAECTVLSLGGADRASRLAGAAALRAADVVHLAGGSAPVIVEALAGTALEQALRTVPLLVAESGGAMALGAWAFPCPDASASPSAGLGWLPRLVIEAHFEDPRRRRRLTGLLRQRPELGGVGLESGSAWLIHHGAREGVTLRGTVHLMGEARRQPASPVRAGGRPDTSGALTD